MLEKTQIVVEDFAVLSYVNQEELNNLQGGELKQLIMILIFVFAWSTFSKADVEIKRKTTADMSGLMTMESNASDVIKGDKSASDMTSQMTGGMMANLGGGKPRETINITRIDKGINYEIDPEKKVYTETPLASLKEQFAKSKKEPADTAKSDYIWTSDVKTTGENQKINGFDCKNILGKATGVKRDNPSDSIFITFDEWMANNVPGQSEIEQFQKDYAKALGMDEMWSQKNLGQMMKDYGPQMQALALKMQESGGYPIKSVISVEGAATAGVGKEAHSGNQTTIPPDVMKKMGGLLGKKKTEEPKSDEVSQGGREKTLMITMEVLSVEQKPVDDAQFEVPAGYNKK